MYLLMLIRTCVSFARLYFTQRHRAGFNWILYDLHRNVFSRDAANLCFDRQHLINYRLRPCETCDRNIRLIILFYRIQLYGRLYGLKLTIV